MLGIVWFWETAGRELYFYKNVVVLSQDVKRGTLITENMLSLKKFEVNKIIDQAINEGNEVIGLEAKHFIPKNTQLHPFYFESPGLLIGKNKYIMRIPNQWLYAVPNSLRRKDHILLYEIGNSNLINRLDENTSNIQTLDQKELEKIKDHIKFVFSTEVAYVKDSANREVRTLSVEERLDGSSVISEVDIIITEEQLKTLEQSVRNGGAILILNAEGGMKE